jgi:hypothetical protein
MTVAALAPYISMNVVHGWQESPLPLALIYGGIAPAFAATFVRFEDFIFYTVLKKTRIFSNRN